MYQRNCTNAQARSKRYFHATTKHIGDGDFMKYWVITFSCQLALSINAYATYKYNITSDDDEETIIFSHQQNYNRQSFSLPKPSTNDTQDNPYQLYEESNQTLATKTPMAIRASSIIESIRICWKRFWIGSTSPTNTLESALLNAEPEEDIPLILNDDTPFSVIKKAWNHKNPHYREQAFQHLHLIAYTYDHPLKWKAIDWISADGTPEEAEKVRYLLQSIAINTKHPNMWAAITRLSNSRHESDRVCLLHCLSALALMTQHNYSYRSSQFLLMLQPSAAEIRCAIKGLMCISIDFKHSKHLAALNLLWDYCHNHANVYDLHKIIPILKKYLQSDYIADIVCGATKLHTFEETKYKEEALQSIRRALLLPDPMDSEIFDAITLLDQDGILEDQNLIRQKLYSNLSSEVHPYLYWRTVNYLFKSPHAICRTYVCDHLLLPILRT